MKPGCEEDLWKEPEIVKWRNKVSKDKEGNRCELDTVRWAEAVPHVVADTLPSDGMRLRWTGNKRFVNDDFAWSAQSYTQGVKEAQQSAQDIHLQHVFYTNRASANLPLGNYALALSDAQKAIDCRKGYVRAYIRKALALLGLSKTQEAGDTVFMCVENCTLKPDDWLYMTSILHKCNPLKDDIIYTISMLHDGCLKMVPQFLIAILYHLLHLLAQDEYDPIKGVKLVRRKLPVDDESGTEHDSTSLHEEELQKLGFGVGTPSEVTSKRLSSVSDGHGINSLIGRMHIFTSNGGVEVLHMWQDNTHEKVKLLVDTMRTMVTRLMPAKVTRHITQKANERLLPPSVLKEIREAPEIRNWSVGDFGELLIGTEWFPCKVLKLREDSGIEVVCNSDVHVVTAPELRLPHVQEIDEWEDEESASSERVAQQDKRLQELSREWKECEDKKGRVFYYHQTSGRAVRELTEEVLRGMDVPETSSVQESSNTDSHSDTEKDSASEKREQESEEMIHALQTGAWVVVRNLRTGHKYYYQPSTKVVTEDLEGELRRMKMDSKPSLDIDTSYKQLLRVPNEVPLPPSESADSVTASSSQPSLHDPTPPILDLLGTPAETAEGSAATEQETHSEVIFTWNEERQETPVEQRDEPQEMEVPSFPYNVADDSLEELRQAEEIQERLLRLREEEALLEMQMAARCSEDRSASTVNANVSLHDLQEMAKMHGLQEYGSKEILIQRIQDYQNEEPRPRSPTASERKQMALSQIAAAIPDELIQMQRRKERAAHEGNEEEVKWCQERMLEIMMNVSPQLRKRSLSHDGTLESLSPMSPEQAAVTPRVYETPGSVVSPLLESLGGINTANVPPPALQPSETPFVPDLQAEPAQQELSPTLAGNTRPISHVLRSRTNSVLSTSLQSTISNFSSFKRRSSALKDGPSLDEIKKGTASVDSIIDEMSRRSSRCL